MTSSLYDGLEDVELSKGSSTDSGGWVLGGTSTNPSSTPANSTTAGIGRLVAAASGVGSGGSGGGGGGFSSLKFMQSHIAVKRAHGRRGGDYGSRSAVAPVVDLQRRGASGGGGGAYGPNSEGSYRFNQVTGKMERVVIASPLTSSGGRPSAVTATVSGPLYGEPNLSLGIPDEYNPLCPNDYEELIWKKRDKRKLDDRSRENNGSGFSRRPNLSGSDSGGSSDDSDDREDRVGGGGGGGGGGDRRVRSHHHRRRPPPPPPPSAASRAAIAPPSSLLEDVIMAPVTDDDDDVGGTHDRDKLESDAHVASGNYGINLVAAKMMARMGYRQGQGLGKEGQGMSSALVVEKTSRRTGKIIHERDRHRGPDGDLSSGGGGVINPDQQIVMPPASATEVVLLENMCGGPNEVDDDLEPETAEECAKYGPVVTCMIYQLPDAGDGPEAVRIFVEFENTEAATRAVLDLNGRFFGGRVVKAGFYDADRFRNLELADPSLL